jgi:hypothetical protein
VVHSIEGLVLTLSGFVTADGCLQLQMIDGGFENRPGHQGSTSVVKMQDALASRSIKACTAQIK